MCATGLRHAPTFRRELSQISRGPSRTEARAQDAETITDAFERLRVRGFLDAAPRVVFRLATAALRILSRESQTPSRRPVGRLTPMELFAREVERPACAKVEYKGPCGGSSVS